MTKLNLSLLLWAALALIACKQEEDQPQIEIIGKLMKTTSEKWVGVNLELVEITGTSSAGNQDAIIGTDITDNEGGFRFTYEQNPRNIGGESCDNKMTGLYLRNSATGKYIFSCFPSNQNIASIFYTGNTSFLRLVIADTIGAGDTLFFPYPPIDSNDQHYIQLTDSFGQTYPYFFVKGPKKPFVYEYYTYFNNTEYQGYKGVHHGEEAFQWFVRNKESFHSRLETWRPKGQPYRDTINLRQLYIQ